MKEEFIIGEKVKIKKNFIIYLFIESVVFYVLSYIFINMLANTVYFIQYPEILTGLKVMFLLIYLIDIFYNVTSMSFKQYITVDKNYLCYYANVNFISQIINSYHILFNKERTPVFKISLPKIKKIVLLYNTITSSFYYKGHSIVYRIELNDGTSMTINPESFHFSNDNIVEGIQYMKDKGIIIDDPYQLIEGLKNKNIKFADYVERMILNDEDHC